MKLNKKTKLIEPFKNYKTMKSMATIQIVYGSNGGNTQLVCEYIADKMKTLGHQVYNARCEHFPTNKLTQCDVLVLACPTYEHGSLEPSFEKNFWPRIQDLDLKQQACAVVGLGDIKYDIDYHIESARILQKYIETHNGRLIHPSLMISGKVLPLLDKLVNGWCDRLHTKL
jgi:flavodoxin I/flavodoxin II